MLNRSVVHAKPKRSKVERRSVSFETLESRRVFANFGTPWPNARNLSVSFPSDSASIGHYTNSVRQNFDQVADRAQWQEAALRAFQTWSVHANFNVGLVPDRGDRFGAVGLSTEDPRFGEFRIGAFPQTNVLANAFPYQQPAGTWSGDVLLNTRTNYFLGDWQSGGPIDVPGPNEKGPAVELYSVLLHEAGNALGLEDNAIAGAVMNGTYSGPNGTLKSTDIASIRNLYGPRQDIYEPTSNGTRGTARPITTPAGYTGAAPLTTMGSLNSQTDVDFYRFTPLPNRDTVSVRLRASGISLVKATLEVQDRFGNKLADVKADSIFQNNLQIDIGSLRDHTMLYIRVAKNANDVFAIGDYGLDIDYRPLSQQPSIIPPIHDSDATDEDDDVIDYVSVDALFASVGLLDREVGLDDRIENARRLTTTTGFNANTRYEVTSTIASPSDRDMWRFRSPRTQSPLMRISVDPVGLQNPEIESIVLDAAGNRVASQVTRRPDGGYSITVENPQPNRDYILFLRAAASSQVRQGNYVVTIDFATNQVSGMQNVYSASVTPTTDHVSEFNVNKTQLFRMDLFTTAPSSASGVQLSFYNAKTGDIVASVSATGNSVGQEFIWLAAGKYFIRANPLTQSGSTPRNTSFQLRVDVLSDDQGPRPNDPTAPGLPPGTPDYDWRSLGPGERPRAIVFVEPSFQDPWTSRFNRMFSRQFYYRFLRR